MREGGVFIVCEGVDGSGKTGAVDRLAETLARDGRGVVATREPGGTEAGQALRRLILAGNTYDWTPTAELLLLNAARAQHVERVIRPALERGAVVVCDRFVGSTLAYQGAGRGIEVETILALHRLASGDLWPDLTILLDIDPATAIARSRRRLAETGIDEGRFERLDLDFHRRVRQSFLKQAAARPERFAVIDADRAPAEVQAEVARVALERVGAG